MNRNKIIGALAIGGAAYMLRNKDSRTKAKNQLKSLSTSENFQKIKNKIQTMSNTNSKGASSQKPKLVKSLTSPALPDYATTDKEKAGRP
jgi:hypothetical protein